MLGYLEGALHKKGQFKNETTGELIDYDNVVLTILIPPTVGGAYDPVEAVGMTIDSKAKFAYENLSQVFGNDVKCLEDVSPLIGRKVEYFFDGNKKVCKVMVSND